MNDFLDNSKGNVRLSGEQVTSWPSVPVARQPADIKLLDNLEAYVCTPYGELSIINLRNHDVETLNNLRTAASNIAISEDRSKAYYCGSGRGAVSVYDIANKKTSKTIDNVGGELKGLALHPDGVHVYSCIYRHDVVAVVNVDTNEIKKIPVAGRPSDIVITRDGARLYTCNRQNETVSVINTETEQVENVVVGGFPEKIAIDPRRDFVYVVCLRTNEVSVIDMASNKVVKTVPVAHGPFSIAVSPDGGRIYVGSHNVISVIDAETYEVLDPITIDGVPDVIAVSDDSAHLYVLHTSWSTVSVVTVG